MNPDWINGALEFSGGLLILWNVRKLLKDKMIRGISVGPAVFFDTWGLWNLYYYPSLDQWWSFAGSVVLTAANIWWACLAIYYTRMEQNAKRNEGIRQAGTQG